MHKKQQIVGHLIALFTVFIWGTTFVSTKVLLEEFTPVEVLFTRFAIGLLVLYMMNHKKMKLKDRKHEWYFIGAGITGITLYFLFENIALTYSTASNIGILLACVPFMTGILSYFIMKEPLNRAFFIGFVFTIIGIYIINFNGQVVLKLNPLGDFLAIIAGFIWALYCIFLRKIEQYEYDTIQTTRRIFGWGILFMIPVLILMGYDPKLEIMAKPVYLANFLYLGIGACAVCFVTWNIALKMLGVVKTSMYLYLNPVITIIASAIILNERITWIAILGTIFILLGLIISQQGAQGSKKEMQKKNEDA
ncbi:MAG: DMT family transporter [Firmicutes bacterium]|uniref:DMT family transporter n=1 Tax=Candidatus Scybalomonas excrementavium TaxID=2840943 RepID=A0A9D9I1U0_9FIRM|nr:DMT family transporter [Candidatus Scybalomonas excrementavium]